MAARSTTPSIIGSSEIDTASLSSAPSQGAPGSGEGYDSHYEGQYDTQYEGRHESGYGGGDGGSSGAGHEEMHDMGQDTVAPLVGAGASAAAAGMGAAVAASSAPPPSSGGGGIAGPALTGLGAGILAWFALPRAMPHLLASKDPRGGVDQGKRVMYSSACALLLFLVLFYLM